MAAPVEEEQPLLMVLNISVALKQPLPFGKGPCKSKLQQLEVEGPRGIELP